MELERPGGSLALLHCEKFFLFGEVFARELSGVLNGQKRGEKRRGKVTLFLLLHVNQNCGGFGKVRLANQKLYPCPYLTKPM